ncbi:hypothetical protein AB0J86_08505 [Micromonospora sp. NPDC049559]|uniref:hypothetical protein n=1 Tax=Micromonospora sp. NPDC049559 TaxID=3155923 RepID=UPI003434136F
MTGPWHDWPQDGPDFDGDGTGAAPDGPDDGGGFDDGPTAELGRFEPDDTRGSGAEGFDGHGFGADAGPAGEPGLDTEADPGPADDPLGYAGETGARESFGHLGDDAGRAPGTEASAPLGYADDPYGPDAGPGEPTDPPGQAGMGSAGEPFAEAGMGAGQPAHEAGLGPAGDGPDPPTGGEPTGDEPYHEAGLGPAGDDPDDPYPGADDWPRAAPFGTDPDLEPVLADWPAPEFPPPLELDSPPEPVDGPPWADPDLLGTGGPDADPDGTGPPAGFGPADPTAPHRTATDDAAAEFGPPAPDGLTGYAGETLPEDADPWTALAGSEDPATGALARFWAPPRPE